MIKDWPICFFEYTLNRLFAYFTNEFFDDFTHSNGILHDADAYEDMCQQVP